MEPRLVLPVSVDKDVLSAAEHSYPSPFFFPLLQFYCGCVSDNNSDQRRLNKKHNRQIHSFMTATFPSFQLATHLRDHSFQLFFS